MTARYVLGLDLGQANDFTALIVLERARSELHLRHAERLPLGMAYPKQVDRVAALVNSPEIAHEVRVAVDSTGVGRAVTDLLQEALRATGTPLTAVTITGGSTASRAGSRWLIPKRDLIACAQVALQTRRLRIAAALPLAQTLLDEFANYRVTITDDGRDTYGNGRGAPNDDLVLATAIACYVGSHPRRQSRITYVGRPSMPAPNWLDHADMEIRDSLFR